MAKVPENTLPYRITLEQDSVLTHINSTLENMGTSMCLKVTLACTFLFGFIDYFIGPELSFSVFYTIPIMVAAWYGSKWTGFIVAIVSALVWLSADLASGLTTSSIFVSIWNTLVRLTFFSIILWLLLIVRNKLAFEESLADTDPLTGLANSRAFHEQLERECIRVQRYPAAITIAYLDLDNFKSINDSWGHSTGDELLQLVAKTICNNIRASDLVARLGGDEFAIMFPALGNAVSVETLTKLHSELNAIMQLSKWPVTFSIGAMTFTDITETNRDMLKRVDDLMYKVKKTGKNNILHQIYPEPGY